MPTTRRLPVSSRHAFALAFDLAVRRDWLHSLVVPLALRLPWIVIPAVLPFFIHSMAQSQVVLVQLVGVLLDFVAMVVVTSMLRFRARSVFHAPLGTPLGPVGTCYRQGLGRIPALYVTELVRSIILPLSFSMLFVPVLYLGFKLSLATETVVLRGESPVSAFVRSFRLTEGRFERWLEMTAISVFLIVPLWFVLVLCFLVAPSLNWNTQIMPLGCLVAVALQPIVQYAWTFFYLRLEDSEAAAEGGSNVVTPPANGGTQGSWRRGNAPQLRLVELARDDAGDDPQNP
jgi:hypothetical protein